MSQKHGVSTNVLTKSVGWLIETAIQPDDLDHQDQDKKPPTSRTVGALNFLAALDKL